MKRLQEVISWQGPVGRYSSRLVKALVALEGIETATITKKNVPHTMIYPICMNSSHMYMSHALAKGGLMHLC